MKVIEVGKVQSKCPNRTLVELEPTDFDAVVDGEDGNGVKMRFALYTCTCCKQVCRVPWDMIPVQSQAMITDRLGAKVRK